jgi:hypothetical protein
MVPDDLIDAGTRLDRLPLLEVVELDVVALDVVELQAVPRTATAARAPPIRRADLLVARCAPGAAGRRKGKRNLLLLKGCLIVTAPFSLT